MTSKCFMLIEGCLMQSLACRVADVANLNSFSLPPLGLAWMTSLHFSLDQSLKSVMEEKHIHFKHGSSGYHLHQFIEQLTNYLDGKRRCVGSAVLKQKVAAGLRVQRSQCHYIHFISCMN